jgi:lysophospholipase L1-like esterase
MPRMERARIATSLLAVAIAATACTQAGLQVEHVSEPTPPSIGRVRHPSPLPTPTRHDQALLVLGDSLTVGARDQGALLAKLTERGWQPTILAEIGRTTKGGLRAIEELPEVPRVVLVGLGTNPGPAVEDFEEEVVALIDALRERGARKIVWVPPTASDPELYAERDEVLHRLAAQRKIRVTDWVSLLGAHPEWFHVDGLHLTVSGYQALADDDRDALEPL